MPQLTASRPAKVKIKTPIAVELCRENGLLFEEAFRYQYVISSSEMGLPGFVTHRLNDLVLQTGGALRCLDLEDATGRRFGFIFGVSASHDGRTTVAFLTEDFDSTAPDAAQIFEDRLTNLVGRYGVIVSLGDQHRFYADASAMIGANYNASTGVVAATVNLCIAEPAVPDGLVAAKPNAFALHYTSDHSVKRLNPNHFLDLKTFETKRFWPRDDDVFHLEPSQYAQAFDEIILEARNVLTRLVAENSIALPLSGGYDSRSILAVADDETLLNIDQIYTHVTTKVNIADVSVANQICDLKSLGLEVHNTLRHRKFPGAEDADLVKTRYQIASGGSGQPHDFLINGTFSRVKRDSVVLRGQQIPVLRGLFVNKLNDAYWTAERISERFQSLLNLNDVMDDDLQADFAKHVSLLYAELPAKARARALDLLLVEAVNGPELANWMCAISHNFYCSPYNSRRMIQLFACFDTHFRRTGAAMNTLFMRADPAILGIAFWRSAKGVGSIETHQSVQERSAHLNALSQTYESIFGEDPSPIKVIRFRTDGIVR